jgi:hypothetical protein
MAVGHTKSQTPMGLWNIVSKCSARACARYGVLVVGEEMKGSRTLLRKVEQEEAVVPEAIERLISRGETAVRRLRLVFARD